MKTYLIGAYYLFRTTTDRLVYYPLGTRGATTPHFLLLEDNTSFFLLEDGTSKIQLEQ